MIRKRVFSQGSLQSTEQTDKRIQEFLSETPYWVDVEYVRSKNSLLTVVEEQRYEVYQSEEYKTRFKCDGIYSLTVSIMY